MSKLTSLRNKKIGIALGGGGIRGLAHVPILKVLDELQIRPSLVAGTSIGAIIGALYASGMSAENIEDRVKQHILLQRDNVKSAFKKSKQLLNWVRVFTPETARGGIVDADGLFQHLFDEILDLEFCDLAIPFEAVATDFYTTEEVVLNDGPLLQAVLASMSVPGVFAPQVLNGQTLVDGGLVNNLPYDLLQSRVDFCIAVQLTCPPVVRPDGKLPAYYDVAASALDIMEMASTRRKLHANPPDAYVHPHLENVGLFDFHKIEHVLERGAVAAEQLREQLLPMLD